MSRPFLYFFSATRVGEDECLETHRVVIRETSGQRAQMQARAELAESWGWAGRIPQYWLRLERVVQEA